MTPIEPPWGDKAGLGCLIAVATGLLFWAAVVYVIWFWSPP